MGSKIKYISKLGREMMIPFCILIGVSISIMAWQKAWLVLIALVIFFLYMVYLFRSTRYVINDFNLEIYYGNYYHKVIPIAKIRHIKETNEPRNAPAFSLDRLEIMYGDKDKEYISPLDKAGFIEHLTSLNNQIELKMRKNRRENKM
ncbi:MAG: PH domain-containing protein [Bacteroidota bacterium]|nr:PH domain-containing protein [Bacteroidota bacterium]